MFVTFERQPFGGWVHPFQHIQPRRHCRPYTCGNEAFVRPAWNPWAAAALGHLMDLADSFETEQEKPKQEAPKDFQVNIDVKQFKPEELSVKMVGNSIVIEGKHEEKEDGQGFVSRQFVRRYELPKDVKLESVTCNLGNDGQLVLSAPRMIEEKKEEKTLPITIAEKEKPATEEEKKAEDGEKMETEKPEEKSA